MSTRILNIEKLEKKFASLTRSRDSIQNLSLWIIKHKEFYKEIVNQWLDALRKDFNALTMFYVANDVIQNCGRKKAPEFRDAFATVLESAVSLEKVKEIKHDVIRMITLWHERDIYDDDFFKILENKLNTEVTSESDTETEFNEDEIIANFKLENLINSIRTVKVLKNELYEKEAFLDDIEEPVLSNIDNMIIKMESQKEFRKCDKYYRLLQDYINLIEKVVAAKKALLLNLKYSSIFYNAQLEDAKKVAHAYRIYGKKVKHLEKALLEKMPTLPNESPTLSPESPDIDFDSPVLSPSSSSIQTPLFENIKSAKMGEESVSPTLSPTLSLSSDYGVGNVSKNSFESTAESKIASLDYFSQNSEKKSYDFSNSMKEMSHTSPKDLDQRIKEMIQPSTKDLHQNVKKVKELDQNVKSTSDLFINVDQKVKKTPSPKDEGVNSKKVIQSPVKDLSLRRTSQESTNDLCQNVKKDSQSLTKDLNQSFKNISQSCTKDLVQNATEISQPLSTKDLVQNATEISQPLSTKDLDFIAKPNISQLFTKDLDQKISSQLQIKDAVQNIKESKSPDKEQSQITKVTQLSKDLNHNIKETSHVSPKKSTENVSVETLKCSSAESGDNSVSKTLSTKISPVPDILDDETDVHSLLEKAYDAQVKSKLNFKRKIDNLLKLNQAKMCKLADDTESKPSVENIEVESTSKASSCETNETKYVEVLPNKENNSADKNIKDVVDSTSVQELFSKETKIESGVSEIEKEGTTLSSNQSDKILQDTGVSATVDDSKLKSTLVSNPFMFQTLPDIPTELLKNILDKYKTNQSASTEISLSVKESVPESSAQDDLNSTHVVKPETQINDKNLELQSTELKSIENSTETKQLKTIDTSKNNDNVNSSNFLNKLQTILEYFTNKSSYKEVKCSDSFQPIPLENTLRIYNCLMQNSNKINTSMPSRLNVKEEFKPQISNINVNEGQKTDLNGPLTMSVVDNNSNIERSNTTVNLSCVSKVDNLEIMDMEVDSDNET